MSEPIKISTGEYKTKGQVEIDGHLWEVSLPGAGTELRLSQAFRGSKLWSARIGILDKKIDSGKITEQELDKLEEYSQKYEENEKIIFDFFLNMFKDGTPDNASVTQWINDTPTAVIQLVFEDVKEQANKQKETDGRESPSESS